VHELGGVGFLDGGDGHEASVGDRLNGGGEGGREEGKEERREEGRAGGREGGEIKT